MAGVRIGVIGDFDPDYLYHQATNLSLELTSRAIGLDLACEWTPTASLRDGTAHLDQFDGLWASPGSPYQSMEGALEGIRYARERGKPFVGT